jgi:hypothetical protein
MGFERQLRRYLHSNGLVDAAKQRHLAPSIHEVSRWVQRASATRRAPGANGAAAAAATLLVGSDDEGVDGGELGRRALDFIVARYGLEEQPDALEQEHRAEVDFETELRNPPFEELFQVWDRATLEAALTRYFEVHDPPRVHSDVSALITFCNAPPPRRPGQTRAGLGTPQRAGGGLRSRTPPAPGVTTALNAAAPESARGRMFELISDLEAQYREPVFSAKGRDDFQRVWPRLRELLPEDADPAPLAAISRMEARVRRVIAAAKEELRARWQEVNVEIASAKQRLSYLMSAPAGALVGTGEESEHRTATPVQPQPRMASEQGSSHVDAARSTVADWDDDAVGIDSLEQCRHRLRMMQLTCGYVAKRFQRCVDLEAAVPFLARAVTPAREAELIEYLGWYVSLRVGITRRAELQKRRRLVERQQGRASRSGQRDRRKGGTAERRAASKASAAADRDPSASSASSAPTSDTDEGEDNVGRDGAGDAGRARGGGTSRGAEGAARKERRYTADEQAHAREVLSAQVVQALVRRVDLVECAEAACWEELLFDFGFELQQLWRDHNARFEEVMAQDAQREVARGDRIITDADARFDWDEEELMTQL